MRGKKRETTMCAENIAIASSVSMKYCVSCHISMKLFQPAGNFTKAGGRDEFQFLLRKFIDFHASST